MSEVAMAGMDPETAQHILDACVEVWEQVKKAILALAEAIQEAFKALSIRFRAWLETLLRDVNPRVCHLAFHARKRRVRKKNLRRLLRQLAAP